MKTFKNIILLSSILAINLTFFGCMNFVPYAMQPSYYEFKKICELNKLPNNEEKYNKLLKYYNLDWDTMIKTIQPIQTKDKFQIKYKLPKKQIGNRITINLSFFVYLNDDKQITRISPWAYVEWDNKIKYLDRESIGSYNLVLKSDFENCIINTKEESK